jgi:hypothetical protein
MAHPKLREIIHGDLFDLMPIESQLAGYVLIPENVPAR